jgi:hypothetical protein
MPQPTWNGLAPPVIDEGTGMARFGRGDWQAGQGGGPLERPKWMPVVDIDGRRLWGIEPQMPSVGIPEGGDIVYPGETPWDQYRTLDLRVLGFADGVEHHGLFRCFAASFFDGWGDHPQDAWEWGHYNTADLYSPAVIAFRFTLAGSPPPPPPLPAVPTMEEVQRAAQGELQRMVAYWRSVGKTDQWIFDTFIYQIQKGLGLMPGDSRRVNVKEFLKRLFA